MGSDVSFQHPSIAAPRSGGPAAATVAVPVGDEVLAIRLRNGDAAAGDTLVRRHHAGLTRYLRRMTGSDHLAEELHQQTWLSVLDHIDRFEPAAAAGGFKAWLFRIATNKTNDHWRSRGRERAAVDGLRLVVDEELPAADHKLVGTEEHHKLKAAIERLPPPQREVLLLRYYSNMKFVDIAKALGCPLNTALGRMHKATIKLRQMMTEG